MRCILFHLTLKKYIIIIIIIIENCQKELSLSTLCRAAAGNVGFSRFCEVNTLLMAVSLNLKVVHVGSCGEADHGAVRRRAR